jgi:heme-degrading monooxygenase HmoA
MVVSVLSIAVHTGGEDDFVRAFDELGVFEHSRRSGGFHGGRLLRPLAEGRPFLVVAEWDDSAAYQRWLDSPAREELKTKIEPLVAGEVAGGGLYEDV